MTCKTCWTSDNLRDLQCLVQTEAEKITTACRLAASFASMMILDVTLSLCIISIQPIHTWVGESTEWWRGTRGSTVNLPSILRIAQPRLWCLAEKVPVPGRRAERADLCSVDMRLALAFSTFPSFKRGGLHPRLGTSWQALVGILFTSSPERQLRVHAFGRADTAP
jgi:hypothetical protein